MRTALIIFFFTGTLAMIFVMGKTGKGLNKQKDTPAGIINLELAYNTSLTEKVMNAWEATPIQPVDYISVAKNNTWWDFLFLLMYSPFLFLACKQSASKFYGIAGTLGKKIAIGAIIAGLLDSGENAGMLFTLSGNQSPGVAMITAVCSGIKWLLVIISVLYLLVAGTGLIIRKLNQGSIN